MSSQRTPSAPEAPSRWRTVSGYSPVPFRRQPQGITAKRPRLRTREDLDMRRRADGSWAGVSDVLRGWLQQVARWSRG